MSINNFTFKKIGEYLASQKYYIPEYQREYAWERSELEDFWMDLKNVIKDDLDLHFLGQIVIHDSKEESKKYIIDGQQRTCTAVILLSVIRDHFNILSNENHMEAAQNNYEDIRIMYLGRWTPSKDELKLVLGNVDKDFFKSYIQIGEKGSKTKLLPSEKRIKDAYDFFNNEILSLIGSITDPEDKFELLELYYTTFIEKFKVLYFESNDMNEAFVIFETLNARGKDLETSDLLKNHIIRNSNQFYQNVIKNWDEMKNTLGKIDATRYIRHYYNSSYEFVREKDLYKKLREKINSPKKANEFSSALALYAKTYCALSNPEEENEFDDKSLRKSLINLNIMGATLFYPIILAMVDSTKFKEKDIQLVATKIETLVFRNLVIAGKVANIYELKFSDIAYNIHEMVLDSVDIIVDEITKLIIDDETFVNSFQVCEVKKKPVIRYIFRELIHLGSSEMKVIDDNDIIHIEHIMPVSIGTWNITPEEHQDYLWRLGNLTLLGSEFNEQISNSTFDVKKKVYLNSQITMNNDLAKKDEWNIREITSRQKELATLALKRWAK